MLATHITAISSTNESVPESSPGEPLVRHDELADAARVARVRPHHAVRLRHDPVREDAVHRLHLRRDLVGRRRRPEELEAVVPPRAVVERVVDGDTIIVEVAGQRERVRLLGIDTPESVAENRPDQCYGEESSVYLSQLLPAGTEVTLIRDVEARDQYDRLLAYVVRSSDELFINLDLLEQGFAGVLIYEPNSYYRDLFEAAEDAAFADDRGLWGVCGGPDVPLE